MPHCPKCHKFIETVNAGLYYCSSCVSWLSEEDNIEWQSKNTKGM
jgi:hypothetical protein